MSRLRWGLGAVLAIISLIVAASALRTYFEHKLWLGGLTVVVLVAIDLAGFGSLAWARRRLAKELAALAADPPAGSLFDERRRRLTALRAAGVRPDLEALAESTAARELGRAYLGKYLVAVTVLVGLVGTFGGLMETLRSVAPLLADERITTLKALAGPLAGLDVTFGASLVGILVTLALALVQGDLALAEEEALAQLEERTRHVLLPSLWPPDEAAPERAARELSALRGELGSFVARAAEQAGERVARIAAVEVDRMVRAVRAAVDESMQGTSARVETGLLGMASSVETTLATVLHKQDAQLSALQSAADHAAANAVDAGKLATGRITQAAEATLSGITDSVERLGATQQLLLGELGAVLHGATTASRESIDKLETALQALAERQAAASEKLLAVQAAESARLVSVQTTESARLASVQAAESTRLASVQAAESARLIAAQADASARAENAVQALVAAQASRAAALDAAQAARVARLDERQAESVERVERALSALATAHATETTRLQQRHAASVEQVEAALGALLTAQAAQDAARQERQAETAARGERALSALVESQAASLSATTETLCETVRTSLSGEGLRLSEATQTLAAGARDLETAAQALGGPLTALAPGLEALTREVALLAARSESTETAATLDELVRLGEGLERLESLLVMAQGQPHPPSMSVEKS